MRKRRKKERKGTNHRNTGLVLDPLMQVPSSLGHQVGIFWQQKGWSWFVKGRHTCQHVMMINQFSVVEIPSLQLYQEETEINYFCTTFMLVSILVTPTRLDPQIETALCTKPQHHPANTCSDISRMLMNLTSVLSGTLLDTVQPFLHCMGFIFLNCRLSHGYINWLVSGTHSTNK